MSPDPRGKTGSLLAKKHVVPLLKSAAFGALTGVVFAIGVVALPGAALVFVVSFYSLGWDMSWFPSAFLIAFAGAVSGGVISGALFIKDKYVPYVEVVPDFEADAEDDRFTD